MLLIMRIRKNGLHIQNSHIRVKILKSIKISLEYWKILRMIQLFLNIMLILILVHWNRNKYWLRSMDRILRELLRLLGLHRKTIDSFRIQIFMMNLLRIKSLIILIKELILHSLCRLLILKKKKKNSLVNKHLAKNLLNSWE